MARTQFYQSMLALFGRYDFLALPTAQVWPFDVAERWPREVAGRNYPYWVFSSKGQVMSTRMGCPPGSDRQQFVSAETLLVPYNSRIPLVVFVPEGFEFRSRPFDTRAAGLPAPAR